MGGSGGGGFFPGTVSPDELARRTREAEEKTRDDSFDTDVSSFLAAELADRNDRNVDIEGIRKSVCEAYQEKEEICRRTKVGRRQEEKSESTSRRNC